MTLTLTSGMLTFAASLGEDWARVLLTNLKDGSLIDMGGEMKNSVGRDSSSPKSAQLELGMNGED